MAQKQLTIEREAFNELEQDFHQSLSVEQALLRLNKETTTTRLPFRPKPGRMYLFLNHSKPDDWRADGHIWVNQGTTKLPRSTKLIKKTYFYIASENGYDKRFRKEVFMKNEEGSPLLIHYIGDDSISKPAPHGNCLKQTKLFFRTKPSAIREFESKVQNQQAHKVYKEEISKQTEGDEILSRPRNVKQLHNLKERERRHFPDIHNQKGVQPSYIKPHGRRYIPHGYGIYEEWRPHPQNVQVDYSENGPDWKSRIRYIPDPESPRYPAMEIFENNWHAMRPYPYTYMRTNSEWLLDPGLSNKAMKCTFDGEHKASRTSSDEITHKMLFGRGRTLGYIDKRNGIGEASPGDKNYQVPEYSPGFHKLGSSLPIVEFGANSPWRKTTDTFVPLQPLPQTPREPYRNIARRKEKEDAVKAVKALDNWRPATPLKPEKIEEKK